MSPDPFARDKPAKKVPKKSPVKSESDTTKYPAEVYDDGMPGGRFTSEEMKEKDSEMGTLPDNADRKGFRSHFKTASTVRKITEGQVVSDVGLTGSGKTTRGITTIFCNEIDCVKEIETWNLPSKESEFVIEAMVNAYKTHWILPVKELFIIGTEKSTEECLYSDDNYNLLVEKYPVIHYNEIYVRAKRDKGLEAGVDGVESIKKFNEIMMDLEIGVEDERPNDIGILLDCGSSILGWCNEVIRRNVMQIPKLSKSQGAPAHFWFWRNMKMESTALNFRDFNIPVWQTWQFKKDKDGNNTTEPYWHDKSGQLSSIWLNSYNILNKAGYNGFYSMFMKNRKNNSVVYNVFPTLTANMMFALAIGLGPHMMSLTKMDKDDLNKIIFMSS